MEKPDNTHKHEYRSQTVFAQYEKIYRRPPITAKMKKNPKNKQFVQIMEKEKEILSKVIDAWKVQEMKEGEYIGESKDNTERKEEKSEIENENENELIDHSDNIYSFKSLKGLYIIPRYLSSEEQCDWIKYILSHVSSFSYNNLTNLNEKYSKNSFWQNTMNDLINKTNNKKELNSNSINKSLNDCQFRNLTWVNCGIKYDWTNRKYDLKTVTEKLPQNMIDLCQNVCQLLNKNAEIGIEKKNKDKEKAKEKDKENSSSLFDMIPQTSIINYFQCNSKRPMGGHRDTAEKINVPLISVSLGNTAIFLISSSDETEPIKLYLQSGDVLVMSNESRWAIHCVARVMPDTCPKQLIDCFDNKIAQLSQNGKDKNNDNDKERDRYEWLLCKEYIGNARLNFNVRQVIALQDQDQNHDDQVKSLKV